MKLYAMYQSRFCESMVIVRGIYFYKLDQGCFAVIGKNKPYHWLLDKIGGRTTNACFSLSLSLSLGVFLVFSLNLKTGVALLFGSINQFVDFFAAAEK